MHLGILFTILNHVLSKVSYFFLLWFRAYFTNTTSLQAHFGRGCYRHLKMPGPQFAGRWRSFAALTYHCTPKTSIKKPSANLFVVFMDSTHLAKIPPDSNFQTNKTHHTSLNSFHGLKLYLYLIMQETYARNEKDFIWKEIKRNSIVKWCLYIIHWR